MIRGYLGWLHGKNQKSSIARKLSTLRSFFKFLIRKGVTDVNPVEGILTPKQGKHLPEYLSVDAVFRLLDSIEPDGVLAARNRAIFEMLYSCGIRVSELAGLNVYDVDPAAGTVRVFGKGAKERVVPVGAKALAAIAGYRAALQAGGRRRAPRRRALPEPRRAAAVRAFDRPHPQEARDGLRHPDAGVPAHPAPHLRHPHARLGGRPAQRAGAARAQEPLDHAEVHPREHRAADGNLRQSPPPQVSGSGPRTRPRIGDAA